MDVGGYKKALLWVLAHRRLTLAAGLLSVLLSGILFKVLPNDFIPDEDIGFMLAYTEAAQGTSSDQMHKYQDQVISILRQEPAIQAFVSNSATPSFRQGILFIALVPKDQRKSVGELIPELSAKLSHIPGLNVYLKNVPLIDLNVGPQVRGSFQYLMQSLDSDQLYLSADSLVNKLREDPMFVGVSTDLEVKTPQVNLNLNRDLASSMGITAQTMELALNLGLSGNRVSRIQTPIDQYDLIVELDRNRQRHISTLDDVYLPSSSGKLVPLAAVATWTEGVGPASVNHFAQFPSVTITFSSLPERPLAKDSFAFANMQPKHFIRG